MRPAALFVLAILLCGCSDHSIATPSIANGSTAGSVSGRSWISKEATSGAKLLYVSSYPACGGCVLIFKQKTGALVGVISGFFLSPQGIATDDTGNLYVTDDNPDRNTVWIFAPGSLVPSNSLFELGVPFDVAVGGDGSIYVSNSGPTASIVIYPKGSTVPTSELLDVNAIQGYGVALDKHGNVYWGISTASGYQIDKFARGSIKPINLGIILNDAPQSIAIDDEQRLVVCQPNIPTIDIYKLPSSFFGHFGQTGAPVSIALKSRNGVFVADRLANQVEQYTYPGGKLVKTFAPPNFNPIGVAVYPHP